MKFHVSLLIAFAVLFLATLCFSAPRGAAFSRETPRVEDLGIPFADRYPGGDAVYARNVWDLQAFEGRLYIGAGNYDNRGPAPNAGPVPILAWDPNAGAVIREGEVDDEEISSFEVIGGRLYIPGADPREGWELGNLYRRESGGQWRMLRTIPRAIHAFALTGHAGRLYVGLKATATVPWYVDFRGYGSAVAVSEDCGESWQFVPLGGYAVRAFLQVAGHFYAADLLPGPGLEKWIAEHDREKYYSPVYELTTGGWARRPELTAGKLFPDTAAALGHASWIHRAAAIGGAALYIGAAAQERFGLYRADSLAAQDVRISRIRLPERTFPRDLIVRNGLAFVLLQGPTGEAGVEVSVVGSRDLNEWFEVLHFTAPTFARSFEVLHGDFYFGLGCDLKSRSESSPEDLSPDTGRLIRVCGVVVPDPEISPGDVSPAPARETGQPR